VIKIFEEENKFRKYFLKRPLDIILSLLGLLLSSWLWVLIGIVIILEDGFPIIICQRRVGFGGKIFNSFKFRTMIKSTLTEKICIQATENDSRITKLGRFLRKYALDELPQLLNIFIGDMSFTGPRALLLLEAENYLNGGSLDITEIPGYATRITVRPGLTGIAQIFAPRDIPRRYKFKYDFLFIEKMSFLLDLRLILLSLLITFNGAWEKRHAKLRFLDRRKNRKQ